MRYLGEYTLKVENGKVRFPWGDCANENKTWIVSEGAVDKVRTTVCVIIDSGDVEEYISEKEDDFKIKSMGEVVLEHDCTWEIPEIILNHLKTEDIVFLGVGSFVEIMSAEDMESYSILKEDIEELLKNCD